MCVSMTMGERAALVAELCRNLALLSQCDAARRTSAATVLARYREVADALGCRPEFEAALRCQVALAPPMGDPRAEATGAP